MIDLTLLEIVELNFCKNPLCADFGSRNLENYSLNLQADNPKIACTSCRTIDPIIWPGELEIELQRQRSLLQQGSVACSNVECKHLGLNVHLHPECYYSFGFSGEKQRYRCKACKTTLVDKYSVDNPHLQTHVTILALLLTGFSLKEVATRLHIQAKTLNDHLKTMAAICRHKSSIFDHHWRSKSRAFKLGTDLSYLQPKSHNGVILLATGDLDSHYIGAQCVNFTQHEQAPLLNPARQNRLLERSYLASINSVAKPIDSDDLIKNLDALAQTHALRTSITNPLHSQTKLNYPSKTALVTPIYSATAHYLQLKDWFFEKDKVSLVVTYEPLLASSAMAGFSDLRNKQTLDLLYLMDEDTWIDGKSGNKPYQVCLPHSDLIWSVSEQRHLRGAPEKRAVCMLVESNMTIKQAHLLPKLAPVTNYIKRFHALFSSTINEPRRKLRPEGILPLLDIYRAWNNLCHQENPGETPAVNAGISEKPLSLTQLLQ